MPVLTKLGDTFPARVAASLLTAVGLPQLICRGEQAYLEQARALAKDPAQRQALKTHLVSARQRAPAFDAADFAAGLEALFQLMHRRQQAGLPAAAMDLSASLPGRPQANQCR